MMKVPLVVFVLAGTLFLCSNLALAADQERTQDRVQTREQKLADSNQGKSPVQADRCNKEMKWAIVECDRQFRKDKDTVKHRGCLADARSTYDTCMDPGAK